MVTTESAMAYSDKSSLSSLPCRAAAHGFQSFQDDRGQGAGQNICFALGRRFSKLSCGSKTKLLQFCGV
jgi:hypothetical protein